MYGGTSKWAKLSFVLWLASSEFDFAWHLEDDVGVAGNWSELVRLYSNDTESDLIGQFNFDRKHGYYSHDCTVCGPKAGITKWPVLRMSRKLARAIVQRVCAGEDGHHEAFALAACAMMPKCQWRLLEHARLYLLKGSEHRDMKQHKLRFIIPADPAGDVVFHPVKCDPGRSTGVEKEIPKHGHEHGHTKPVTGWQELSRGKYQWAGAPVPGKSIPASCTKWAVPEPQPQPLAPPIRQAAAQTNRPANANAAVVAAADSVKMACQQQLDSWCNTPALRDASSPGGPCMVKGRLHALHTSVDGKGATWKCFGEESLDSTFTRYDGRGAFCTRGRLAEVSQEHCTAVAMPPALNFVVPAPSPTTPEPPPPDRAQAAAEARADAFKFSSATCKTLNNEFWGKRGHPAYTCSEAGGAVQHLPISTFANTLVAKKKQKGLFFAVFNRKYAKRGGEWGRRKDKHNFAYVAGVTDAATFSLLQPMLGGALPKTN